MEKIMDFVHASLLPLTIIAVIVLAAIQFVESRQKHDNTPQIVPAEIRALA